MNFLKQRRLTFCMIFFLAAAAVAAVYPAEIRFAVIPENPRPGEPITIAVRADVTHAVLLRNERQFSKAPFFSVPAGVSRPGFMAAIITVPSTMISGNAFIRLINDAGAIHEIPLVIAHREFRSETIHLDARLTAIRTDPSPERAAQVSHLWAILHTTGTEVFHTGSFIRPVASTRITSPFGSRRVFQYADGRSNTTIHAGIDFGVPTGTRVVANGAGRVVLSQYRLTTGYSIIIEHAPGIYSIFYHLDSLNVEEGELVNTGALIGLSGATGLATGPHLHWEVRVHTENTDPDAFIARPIIDKNLIISMLYD